MDTEQTMEKIPSMRAAQLVYLLTTDRDKNNETVKRELLDIITTDNAAPFYEYVCNRLGWQVDAALMKRMRAANEQTLVELDRAVTNAQEQAGDTEVRDALMHKAEHFVRIGDREGALQALRVVNEKASMLGLRVDIVLMHIRLGFFFEDRELVSKNIERAQSLIDEGGDWDRRNRLKVYKGLYCLSVRDFKQACTLFLECVATFTSTELLDFKTFVAYTVIAAVLTLDRPTLYTKVICGSDITEALQSLPNVYDYLHSFHNCEYKKFFYNLMHIEGLMKHDRYLNAHYRYYVREVRILAYNQLLESYSSLTLEYLANTFGVTVEFIDQELSRFIAAGRLPCKIDKVGGVVETTRPDKKNFQYQSMIKQGDVLLNRLQKLNRVINI